MSILIPNSISSRTTFKRKFTLSELYQSFIYVPRAMSSLIKKNKSQLVEKEFIERIQLAITEVNGCAACSYQHTKMALNMGMSNEEISSFLTGDKSYIKEEENKGILFAQHFADAKGKPNKNAFEEIAKEYGNEKSAVILASSQVMLAGNMYGLPLSAFQSRIKGKPYSDSTIIYEMGMMLFGLIILPLAIMHGLIRGLIGLPNVKFEKNKTEV